MEIFGASPSPSIRVNPANAPYNRTVKHEEVHALLNQLPPGQLEQLNKSIPIYQKILEQFPSSFGNPDREIPAYAATNELTNIYQHPIQQDWRDAYIQKLHEGLQRLNPKLASYIQQLSISTQDPMGGPQTGILPSGGGL